MDSSLLEMLTEVTVYDLIIALILISAICVIVATQKKRISKLLNKWRKNKNEEEDFHSLVYSLKDSIADLKNTMEQYQTNRENDRDVSKRIRKEIYEDIGGLSGDIQKLTDIIVKMQEKNSKTKRAEIKEKIERIYRECHPSMSCTPTQLEALKELIEEYEVHGGTNSFVHTLVEPEMYEWKVV